MPLHCSPLSRRQFIQRSLLGGLAVLTWREPTHAADVDPNRWALLSDTHIAGDPATLSRGVNMTDHLRAVVAELQGRAIRPAGLMINGDCSLDIGLAEDYTTLTGHLKPIVELGIPLHFTLGNHDDREVFRNAFAAQAALPQPVEGKQISVLETPMANWYLLDSLEKTKQTPGLIGGEQRAWLAKALDARADKPALLMLHHNPVLVNPEKPTGLKDFAELVEVLQPRKQVKAVFFGHTHLWMTSEQEGLHFVNLPAVAYPFLKAAPTGWIDCLLAADRMTLELRATDPEHPAHGTKTELVWRT